MLGTFVNMFRIPELKKKILLTLGILVVYRVGCLLPVPGVNVDALQAFFRQQTGGLAEVLGVVTMLSGGALSQATVFALGIMPYISATIIFQLLTGVIPALEKLRKEGESGLKKIRQYERYTTVLLCLIQGTMLVRWMSTVVTSDNRYIFVGGPFTQLTALVTMTTGTMLLMWLGDRITQSGVGNGISLIIMAGIVSRLPNAIMDMYGKKSDPGTVKTNC